MLNSYFNDINSFTYKGINSLDMGLFITDKSGVYGAAQPVIETVYIPARGTIVLDNKVDELDNEEYEDFEKTYKCCIVSENGKSLDQLAADLYKWLFTEIAYDKLYDTYEQGYYRLAMVKSPASIADLKSKLMADFEVTFICKPFKQAHDGDKVIEITKTATLYNVEAFTAKPYIKIYGSGNVTLYINSRSHAFIGIASYIEIDSETMNVFKGDELQNYKMNAALFPKLVAGDNKISWTGNVSKIEIIPRWCSL